MKPTLVIIAGSLPRANWRRERWNGSEDARPHAGPAEDSIRGVVRDHAVEPGRGRRRRRLVGGAGRVGYAVRDLLVSALRVRAAARRERRRCAGSDPGIPDLADRTARLRA